MKVWVDKNGGLCYHLGIWCRMINGGEYKEIDWAEAYTRGYIPCPICHTENGVKLVIEEKPSHRQFLQFIHSNKPRGG